MIDVEGRLVSFLASAVVYNRFPAEVNEVHQIAGEMVPAGDAKAILCAAIVTAGVIRDIHRKQARENK